MSSQTSFRQASKRTLGEALWPVVGKFASHWLIRRDRGLILMFHYLGAPILPGISEDLFLSQAEFAATLDFVCTNLQPLDPERFLNGLETGTLPPGATLLTFDDCAEGAVKDGLPELAARNLKACWFATPGLIAAGRTVPALELMHLCRAVAPGSYRLSMPEALRVEITDTGSRAAAYRLLWPKVIASDSRSHASLFASVREAFKVQDLCPEARLASWDQLQKLHDAGMWVGNHTMLHSTVQADGLNRFTADVAEAYQELEQRFGKSRRLFCYPYGRDVDATLATAESLRQLSTSFGFVTQGGFARADAAGLLNLRREEASYSAGAVKLAPLLATIR